MFLSEILHSSEFEFEFFALFCVESVCVCVWVKNENLSESTKAH